jgi:hypothetical protein
MNKVQDLYFVNYKTLLKEIKGDLNKREVIPRSWDGWLKIVKMSVLLKLVHRF